MASFRVQNATYPRQVSNSVLKRTLVTSEMGCLPSARLRMTSWIAFFRSFAEYLDLSVRGFHIAFHIRGLPNIFPAIVSYSFMQSSTVIRNPLSIMEINLHESINSWFNLKRSLASRMELTPQ